MIDLTKSVGLNLHKRSSAELRFQSLGIISILVSLGFLAWLLITIFAGSLGAAKHVEINIPVNLSADKVDPNNIRDASFGSIIKSGLRSRFPDVKNRKDKKKLYNLISSESTFELRDIILKNPSILGGEQNIWVSASDDLSLFFRGKMNVEVPEDQRQISDKEINWIEKLNKEGQIRSKVNWGFFKNGDSREPEIAGILAALVGSALSLSVCFVLSFPLGVAAATYLEQFAPRSRISDIIEVNINNLAAVPSIVFGLLLSLIHI